MTFGQGKIWYDGKFVDWKDANVHILAHVIHYGSSVFESLRCYKGDKRSAIFRLDAHIDRLYDSAKIYRMDMPFTKEEFTRAVIDTVKINKLQECYIRPFAFRGYGHMGVNPLKNPVNCAIAAWKWGAYLGEEALEKGVSVCVTSWRRPAPNTFPALAKAGGNYLNSQLIAMDAIEAGYEEGIALDYFGHVSEGSGENIFIVRNGVIYTPPTSASILAGITRHSVFVIARELGMRIEQHDIPREALYISDEVFFSGTAAEITPITMIDHIKVGDGAPGEITKKVRDAFYDIVRQKTEDKHGWLAYID